jgi:pimeloyl-ACP methyl ester carboxylesterase
MRISSLSNSPGSRLRIRPSVELGRAAAALLGDNSIEIMASAAHAPYLETPRAFAEIVSEFLLRSDLGRRPT